ncbi:hypothetical protein CBR_g17694 [Chara braunii]|uniref:Uncharacterized protein n=1 Tax=Chara braunii TaxID=69332 RepID=A0A388KVL6_CHABU|nr:hypothetical protein CBR_g17694 [Chara braunii]|eukprot:GBG73983.1 hypothetical protein CBR_g17694 [Chara braunii]
MASVAQLQHDADDWLFTIQEGGVRLRGIVEAMSAKGRDWRAVEGGGTALLTWTENSMQDMLEVIWELEEGSDPRLEDLLDWRQAKTLMQRCYAIFREGQNLYDAIMAQALMMTSPATTTPATVSSTIHTSAAVMPTTTTPTTTTTTPAHAIPRIQATSAKLWTGSGGDGDNKDFDNNHNNDTCETRDNNDNNDNTYANGVSSGSRGDDDNNDTDNINNDDDV